MPLWLEAAGLPNPGVPNVDLMSLLGHLAYGAILGALYPTVLHRTSSVSAEPSESNWLSAIIAGLAAGVLMGVPMHLVLDVMPAVGALYGYPIVTAGWIAHLFHSTVFALVYGALASLPRLRSYANDPPTGVILGLVYGAAVWVFGSVYVMPIWLGSIGMQAPATPNLDAAAFLAHIVFGAVLGLLYPLILHLRENDSPSIDPE